MHISTFHKGEWVTGVILEQSRFFLEVEITSPYSNYSTSRSVPYFARPHIEYEGEMLANRCNKLLMDLYEFGKLKEGTLL